MEKILVLKNVKSKFKSNDHYFYWLESLTADISNDNSMTDIVGGVVKHIQGKENTRKEGTISEYCVYCNNLDKVFVLNDNFAVIRMIYEDVQRLSVFYTVERVENSTVKVEEFNFYPKWEVPKETRDQSYYIPKIILSRGGKSLKIFYREFYRLTDGPVEMIQPSIYLSLCIVRERPRAISVMRLKTLQEGKYWLLGRGGKRTKVI